MVFLSYSALQPLHICAAKYQNNFSVTTKSPTGVEFLSQCLKSKDVITSP